LRSRAAWFAFGSVATLLCTEASAQYRFTAEPSIEITEVQDSNLFYSAQNQAGDVIQRVRPTLALRFDTARYSIAGSYGFDRDRFATYSALDNARARQNARIDARVQSSPRLTMTLNAAYVDTDTPTDLNIDTGLATARLRAQQISFRPAADLRISPTMTAHVALSSSTGHLADGPSTRAQFLTVGVDRQTSPRDLVTLNYEQGFYIFDRNDTTHTFALRAGWTRALGTRTRMILEGGPRVTDGSLAPELSAAITHNWKTSSISVSAQQTQTAVLGFVGTLAARNLQARYAYAPTRMWTTYVAPSVYRSTFRDLQATVFRVRVGASYAVTPLMGLDVSYSLDSQHGAIVPLQANEKFSRSVLSAGLAARWNGRDWLK
jgi:hypothetical protein